MQGRLRQSELSVLVETECAHCREPMSLEIDSDLKIRTITPDCRPVVFVPDVDLHQVREPNIVEVF